MGLLYLDGMFRGAAIALFLLLSWRFARDWRRSLTARLGALVTLGAASYAALIAINALHGDWPLWRLPIHIMSLASPALFWLFAASWFDDEFELRWWHATYVAVTTGLGLSANLHLTDLGWGAWPGWVLIGSGWRVFGILAVGLALIAAVRGWRGDLVESRRRVRGSIVIAAALTILWIIVTEVAVRGWPQPLALRAASALIVLILGALVAGSTLGWRDPALIAAAPRLGIAAPTRTENDEAPLLARLDADMRHDRLYRQDGLTITAVAARLGVPEYRLRRAINQGSGARNFNAYLNSFRLAETEEALADPTQRDVPILTIAMDAGFGSLAPFNRAFRDRHDCTPTEYRARHLAD